MLRKDELRLRDMHAAALNIRRFTEGLSREDFLADTEKQYAVLHALQIIGEAVANISDETKVQLSDIPWQQIRGMRNRLAHEYFAVDMVIVWDTVQQDIEPLARSLEPHTTEDADDEVEA